MSRYYATLRGVSQISTRAGCLTNIDAAFYTYAGRIAAECNFAQSQLQQLIYISHAQDVFKAGDKVKSLATPKARLEFLSSFQSISDDEEVATVFKFARKIFFRVYYFRSILVHDTWRSSKDFANAILLTSLDEEGRLEFAKKKVQHVETMTSKQTYTAIMRYISSVKLVNLQNMEHAAKDIALCNWCFMQLGFVLNAEDYSSQYNFKKAFYTYSGVSHLFPEEKRTPYPSHFTSSKNKTTHR